VGGEGEKVSTARAIGPVSKEGLRPSMTRKSNKRKGLSTLSGSFGKPTVNSKQKKQKNASLGQSQHATRAEIGGEAGAGERGMGSKGRPGAGRGTRGAQKVPGVDRCWGFQGFRKKRPGQERLSRLPGIDVARISP